MRRDDADRDDPFGEAAPVRRRAASKDAPAAPPRSRRLRGLLGWLGALALAAALIAFVVSFVTGLGGSAGERVTGDAERGGERLDRIGPRIRVEVLNAGGVAGMARRATEQLRDRGFDVVYMGNAATFQQDSTVVYARTADLEAARRVAEALGTDSVVLEPDPQLYLDATVHLGKDWPPASEPAAQRPAGLRDRVGGWLSRDSL